MKKRILTLLIVFTSACAGALLARFVPRLIGEAAAQSPSPPVSSTELARLSDRFEVVAQRLGPAVVGVEATKPGKAAGAAAPANPLEEAGSGVLIRVEGQRSILVLTNNHVIAHAKPEQITINLADGRLFHPGKTWSDPETDVAVMRLDAGDTLPTATLGDSDAVRVGQWVLAIGSPFGLNQTVTHGIISARDRGQIGLGHTIRIKDFLQTDAAINPGSSGGPLVNLNGEVIGINTAIASHTGGSSGVAFSIPINLVKKVTRQLLEKGTVSRGYLGMQLAQAFEPADALNLGLERVRGAWVETVYPDTPAAAAGLRANDVILQVNGVLIRNENHLINHISALTPGERVQLQLWRDRKPVNAEAVVGDWVQAQGRFRARP